MSLVIFFFVVLSFISLHYLGLMDVKVGNRHEVLICSITTQPSQNLFNISSHLQSIIILSITVGVFFYNNT